MAEAEVISDGKIVCQIDGARVHSIQLHIRDNHPEWSIDRYKMEFPDAPLFSQTALLAIERKKKEASNVATTARMNLSKAFLHDVFDLGAARAARNSIGNPIEIDTFHDTSKEAVPYIAEVDPNYVFDINLVKKIIIGFQTNKPVYLWGYHGTGKTTALEQCAARTGRPFIRVQHTGNTEESHILGQYVVRTKIEKEEVIQPDGKKTTIDRPYTITEFQLGPLPMAMLFGWVYCADEYDFAMPSVTAVYQPVLERKALVIKDAPEEFRVIKPHPNFRFVATGNTNGVGDETGLYQGTLIQNPANYSRFPIVEEVKYMAKEVEESILVGKTGVDKSTATKIVKLANDVRENFIDGKISMTISPREIIEAADLGMYFGGDWREGIRLAFTNRLSRVDKEAVEQYAQRIFG